MTTDSGMAPREVRPVAFPHLPSESWQLFLADALPDSAAARIERHLAGCPDCTAALEAADPSRLFHRLSRAAVRPEVWDGFWEGVRSEIAARPARRSRRPRIALVAGLAVAAVATLAFFMRPTHPGLPPRAPRPGDTACTEAPPRLRLTRAECEALYGAAMVPAGAADAVVEFRPDLDLRGL